MNVYRHKRGCGGVSNTEEIKALQAKVAQLEDDKAGLLRVISAITDDPLAFIRWRAELVRRSQEGEDYISFAEWLGVSA